MSEEEEPDFSACSVESIIFFDCNLPGMEDCDIRCDHKKSIFCRHRFLGLSDVVYCNGSLFSSLPDVDMVIYFAHYVLSKIPSFAGKPWPVFIVLTHDEKFINSAKGGWIKKRQRLNPHLQLDFFEKDISVSFMDISFDLEVETVPTVKYGTSRDKDRQRIIEIVNKIIAHEAS